MILRTLQIYIFSFYAFIFSGLFPDAKILKNITQNLIRSNLAGNFTKIMKTLTDILRDEFATESGFKTFVHTLDGCAGITKGFVVTDVTAPVRAEIGIISSPEVKSRMVS